MTTIAAIATPQAAGGISVIRISGENALKIADCVFKAHGNKTASSMAGYTCAYGTAFYNNQPVDDCILTVFRSPHSYTGEDVAELSCHGGIYVTKNVLEAVLDAGAELAEAGEFTKRAFLNGKMTLTQAEAVMDIISASGEQALKAARAMQEGAMFRRIKNITDDIVSMLGALAAWADYPDDDIPEVSEDSLLSGMSNVIKKLDETLATRDYGRILREGVSAVIVGKPNVGKSTLFNLLSGFERSIVTDIAGTTRDVVEECVRLGNVTLRLSDTAGLRETSDAIEQIGVQIAEKRLEEADLVLAVFDGARKLSDEDSEVFRLIKGKKAIAIVNKSDEEQFADIKYIHDNFSQVIFMSAKKGDGLEQLRKEVEKMFYNTGVAPELGILANARQVQCVERAKELVEEALNALQSGILLDAITVLLDESAQALMTLTGERVSDAVVDEVFSKFCVGK
ncbi:MAG: tRNA uridine-5-carboxymethylaminomethyl(34) synthesis GTPase MnmE [Ruminococcus sp.]|nr:tRNA uridine-5-carboxymethylaminomethyl(34) synthesis GTPase MnmE [Ruminococcus sp.]